MATIQRRRRWPHLRHDDEAEDEDEEEEEEEEAWKGERGGLMKPGGSPAP
eukprot:COSAG01_NODE_70096_length_259_cov_1.200000_1_plen_49_part_01